MRKEENGSGTVTAEELRDLFRELPDGQMCIVSFGDTEEDGERDGV